MKKIIISILIAGLSTSVFAKDENKEVGITDSLKSIVVTHDGRENDDYA